MSDTDQSDGGWTSNGETSEMPWRSPEMPCVYCGRSLPRDSQRCPHCKTSYSAAVRRASREIEGPWFYLEPRNPSNRGVDFRTMLKLIEKGRLHRASVVRGPTTKQDWVYAAEAPMLSKHLGVCPHCFAPARGDQEFCDTCYRHLDERPARLRPGMAAPGAECYFPAREVLERELAEALKTHDMGRVASQAAQESTAVEDVFGQESREAAPGVAPPRPRAKPAAERRRVKPHVVALLTVVTVVPLGLLMLALPVERIFGDPSDEGTMAHRVYSNRMGFWRALSGRKGGSETVSGGGGGTTSSERPVNVGGGDEARIIQERLAEARSAVDAGELEAALAIYKSLQSTYPAEKLPGSVGTSIADIEDRIGRAKEEELAVAKVKEILSEHEGGRDQRAKVLLAELSIREKALAKAAGYDVADLEMKVTAALQVKDEEVQRQKRRREIEQFLEQGKAYMRAKRYDLAGAAYRTVRDKYPAEDLPEGTDLAALIRTAENNGVDPEAAPVKPPEPAGSPEKVKADALWAEVQDLENRKEYKQAIAKCEEIQGLPAEVHPQGLAEKIAALKELQKQKEKMEFFLGGGGK